MHESKDWDHHSPINKKKRRLLNNKLPMEKKHKDSGDLISSSGCKVREDYFFDKIRFLQKDKKVLIENVFLPWQRY